MNFINDHITDDDRKRFDFSVFKRPPSFISPIAKPSIWTVDRDAGAFLIWLGDQGHDASEEDQEKAVEYFSLWWNDINVECKLWNYEHAPNAITWKQEWISIPEKHVANKKEIWGALKEALVTYQLHGDASHLLFRRPSSAPLSEIKFDF
jgi:hypothetical protein